MGVCFCFVFVTAFICSYRSSPYGVSWSLLHDSCWPLLHWEWTSLWGSRWVLLSFIMTPPRRNQASNKAAHCGLKIKLMISADTCWSLKCQCLSDGTGVYPITEQYAAECGYSVSVLPLRGHVELRASYFSCHTDNKVHTHLHLQSLCLQKVIKFWHSQF